MAITILAPAGKLYINDIKIPAVKLIKAINAAIKIIALKLDASFRAVKAGKIIKLDISSAPMMRIPVKITSAVVSAIKP